MENCDLVFVILAFNYSLLWALVFRNLLVIVKKLRCFYETNLLCPFLGTCYAFGDGHYRTFDGYDYTFPGKCTYVLVRSQNPDFQIRSTNVKCDYNDAVCSKTVELVIGTDTFRLVRGVTKHSLPSAFVKLGFSLSKLALEVMLHSPKLGLTVTWSSDLRFAIYLTSRHTVSGMCGNKDGDSRNDLSVSGSCSFDIQNTKCLPCAFVRRHIPRQFDHLSI